MYQQTNFFKDLEYQLNPDDFYTPSINTDFPEFIPTVKISKLQEVFHNYLLQKDSDYWEGLCEHSESCSFNFDCYDVNICDEELDLRWQKPKIIIYPISENLNTDTSIWYDATKVFHETLFEYEGWQNDCGI